MRVLVTGGAGYIGSHAAKALRTAGFEPVTLDDLRTGHEWAVRFGPFERGTIDDRPLVGRLIAKYAIEAVMHFAGSAYVRESLALPEKYFSNNAAASAALVEACVTSGRIRAFVFSSTCAVYGVPDVTPIVEGARTAPISPYGESKLFVEKMLDWCGKIHRLPWAALRYFNAAGCDPDGEIGEVHEPETHVVPLLIDAARGGPPFTVLGHDHPTPDGTAIRDYIHVSDLADAHVRCLRYLLDGGASRSFNLGTGSGASVADVIRAVEAIVGPVAVRVGERSPGDPPVLVADAQAAARILSWSPTRSDLQNVVTTAANWHASRPRVSASRAS